MQLPDEYSYRGGVCECQIKTVKSVMNSVLALAAGRLDHASLKTVLYEAMFIVNSRPLVSQNK